MPQPLWSWCACALVAGGTVGLQDTRGQIREPSHMCSHRPPIGEPWAATGRRSLDDYTWFSLERGLRVPSAAYERRGRASGGRAVRHGSSSGRFARVELAPAAATGYERQRAPVTSLALRLLPRASQGYDSGCELVTALLVERSSRPVDGERAERRQCTHHRRRGRDANAIVARAQMTPPDRLGIPSSA